MTKEQIKEYNKKHYENNKEWYSSYQKKYQKARIDFTRQYKSECGCVICGNTDARCLQFHHKNKGEKDFALSNTNISIKNLILEIQKCVVICANHHMIFHSIYGNYDFPDWDDIVEKFKEELN